jgi:hypothetical protein
LVLYGAQFGKEAPEIRLIWCSIPRSGGSPAGTSLGKTSAYSYKMSATIGGNDCYKSCNEIKASLHIKA